MPLSIHAVDGNKQTNNTQTNNKQTEREREWQAGRQADIKNKEMHSHISISVSSLALNANSGGSLFSGTVLRFNKTVKRTSPLSFLLLHNTTTAEIQPPKLPKWENTHAGWSDTKLF